LYKYQFLDFSKTSISNLPKSSTKSTKNSTCIHPLPLDSWILFITVISIPVTGSWLSAIFTTEGIGLKYYPGKSSDTGFWAQIVLVTL
jgi:hypothetical protein